MTTPEARTDPAPTVRHHSLDFLRAFLMLLGIPYHAALPYSGRWLVTSPDQNFGVLLVSQFLHAWRMPVFFIIAGYFALATLRRKGARPWIKGRFRRLGIPLAFGLILINPLETALVVVVTGHSDTFWSTWVDLQSSRTYWVAHLWFLIELLLYCVVLYGLWHVAAARRAGRAVTAVCARLSKRRLTLVISLVVAAAWVAVADWAWEAVDVSGAVGEILSSGVPLYAPFFVLGLVIAALPGRIVALERMPHWSVPVLGAFAYLCALELRRLSGHADVRGVLVVFFTTLSAFFIARILFAVAARLITGPNPVVSWLVDSSLTVYLVHYPVIVPLTALMIALGVPAIPAVLAIIVLATVASLTLYELSSFVPVLRLLFTGTRAEGRTFRDVLASGRTTPTAPAAAPVIGS